MCNEEPCAAAVLEELLREVDPQRFVVAIGVNDSSDRTAEIARRYPVMVAETTVRGYGHGCAAAIQAVAAAHEDIDAYLFVAGDGASDPCDIALLVRAYEAGHQLVLGTRTTLRTNRATMRFSHLLANRALALWCAVLSGRRFSDLAPLRLIDRRLFETIAPREMTYGWTIEAQVAAALLGASICEVTARERRRLAGQQKVSGVMWRQTAEIGCRIAAAGWRTRSRFAAGLRRSPTAAAEALFPETGSA
jgi:hypothetical protein